MPNKQRATPKSTHHQGRTAPAERKTLAKREESAVATKPRTGKELQRPNPSPIVAPGHVEVGRGESEVQ